MELDLKQRHPDNYHMQGCRDVRMQGPPPPIRRDHPKQASIFIFLQGIEYFIYF